MDDSNWDFLNFLHPDLACRILICLDDVGDIVRASSVSRAWRDFIIGNGLCKRLCLRLFPPLSNIERILDVSIVPEELEKFKNEHGVFSSLAARLSSIYATECIIDEYGASSYNNYREEGLKNTLVRPYVEDDEFSYWLSRGSYNPKECEVLTYKLISDICVITEIQVQPFQALLEEKSPIYSAKSVCFRMGDHDFYAEEEEVETPEGRVTRLNWYECMNWTYTSREFPMAQVNRVQRFKLPEPVLCIGGYLQVELIGKVQRRPADGRFFVGVTYVQALGQSLTPVFTVDTQRYPSEKILLKFDPKAIPLSRKRMRWL